MTAEFSANMAREILTNKDNLGFELWYREWKDNLFKRIKEAALKGNNSITINSEEWNNNDHNKQYLKGKLVGLGYSIKVENKIMTIMW